MFKITLFIRTTHNMRILVLFVLTCPKFVLINSVILNLLCVGILFYQIFMELFLVDFLLLMILLRVVFHAPIGAKE